MSTIALIIALAATALLSTTSALPHATNLVPRTALTAAQLVAIAPSSSSCAGAAYPSECRTATQALPYILASFTKYDITHPSVQAALVSLMAYETAEFRYNINHSPGRPGQGTRNMQMAKFNDAYAASLGMSGAQSVIDDEAASWGSAAWFVTSQCPESVRQAMWGGNLAAWESFLVDCVGTSVDAGRIAYWQRAVEQMGSG